MKKETLHKIIILSVSTFFFNVTTHAQSRVPGYLGKKDIISYQAHLYLKSDVQSEKLGLLNNITYERVLSKRSALELSVGYDLSTVTPEESLNGGLTVYPTRASDDWSIKTYSFGLHYKWYNKRRIAPLGGYTAIGINMFNSTPNIDGVTFTQNRGSGQLVEVDFTDQAESYTVYSLFFGVGKTRIIADKFLVNYGINFLINLSDNESSTDNDYIRPLMEDNVNYHNVLVTSFTIGFGFLP